MFPNIRNGTNKFGTLSSSLFWHINEITSMTELFSGIHSDITCSSFYKFVPSISQEFLCVRYSSKIEIFLRNSSDDTLSRSCIFVSIPKCLFSINMCSNLSFTALIAVSMIEKQKSFLSFSL